MKLVRNIAAFFLSLFVPAFGLEPKPTLLSVASIWDQGEHNAFSDLIVFRGTFFCCFREGVQHAGDEGAIRIISSEDGVKWSPTAFLSKKGVDLRDPHLSITPDGRLMLNMGGSFYKGDDYLGCQSQVAFSSDGKSWSQLQEIGDKNEWIWRVTWHKGVGYAGSYRLTDPLDNNKPWLLTLFKTIDGLEYTPITLLDVPNFPSEATIRFLADDRAVAAVRRDGNGWIGTALPPLYNEWKWCEIKERLGGPNFLLLPEEKMWLASRLIRKAKTGGEYDLQTAFGPMTFCSYQPALVLPSSGDTSYPGMVYEQGIIFLSYHSSHSGKTAIYLARIDVK